MENIRTYESSELPFQSSGFPVTIFPFIDRLYLAHKSDVHIYEYSDGRIGARVKTLCNQLMNEDEYIMSITRMVTSDELRTITNTSHIYCLLDPDENELWNLEGTGDSEVDAVAWKHDMSLVAIITNDGFLTLLDNFFDLIVYVDTSTKDFGESRNISIGWGKTSTQFVGKGLKPRDRSSDTCIGITCCDLKKSFISWRQDGKYFATSTWCRKDDRRKIRVWSDKGELHSTCDLSVFLEPVMSWRPNGICIASVQISDESEDKRIVFFEKNGLRHGGFSLRNTQRNSESVFEVQKILWNSSSSVLAVLFTTGHNQHFQLWTTSNYHWYLKLDKVYETRTYSILDFQWFTESSFVLIFNNTILCYFINYGINVSSTGLVAVIDGNNLLFTPYEKRSIPLPYGLCGTELSEFSNEICHLKETANCDKNYARALVAFSNKLELCLVEVDTSKKGYIEPQKVSGCWQFSVACVSNSFPDKICNIRNMVEISKNKLVCIVKHDDDYSVCLVSLDLESSEYSYTLQAIKTFDFGIKRLILCEQDVPNNKMNTMFIQTAKNDIVKLNLKENLLCDVTMNFMKCNSVNIVALKNKNSYIFLYNDPNDNLYINSRRIMKFCSSFVVSKEYVILVESMENLCCIPLSLIYDEDKDKLEEFISNLPKSGFRRVVENGSIIVNANELEASLTLQIPRGNIEIIYPRPLIISKLKSLIEDRSFLNACELIKKHRLDFNLIFDHNPSFFSEYVTDLISQVSNVNLINSIIESLKEEDCTRTIYSSFYCLSDSESFKWSKGKVKTVLQEIRNKMRNLRNEVYFDSILLTLMKESEVGVEDAFKLLINEYKLTELKPHVQFMRSVFQDDEKFYLAALSVHNLDMVACVAEVTNRDPKEYLPFLNQMRDLQNTEPFYMSFKIDCYIGRYENALANLVKSPNRWDELVKFVKKRKSYKYALTLLKDKIKEYTVIAEAFGDYLATEISAFDEAALIFHSINSYEKAFVCSLKVTSFGPVHYHSCLLFCRSLSGDATVLSRSYGLLLDKLMSSGLFENAVDLLQNYIKDSSSALKLVLEKCLWHLLNSVCYQVEKSEETNKNIVSKIKERSNELSDKIIQKIAACKTQVTQLEVFRQNKHEIISTLPEINNSELDNMSYSISTYSQSSTNETCNTFRSAKTKPKNRNKLMKKYSSTRSGSLYEDFALMNSLSKFYLDYDRYKSEISSLLIVLISYNCCDDAAKLQNVLLEWRTYLVESYATIWSTDQYIGPVRKDLNYPDSHRLLTHDKNISSSTPDSKYLDALTPLVVVPDRQKLADCSFVIKHLL